MLGSDLGRAVCSGAFAAGMTFLLTPLVRRVALRYGWVTKPAHDRWNHRLTARLGGVALFGGFLAGLLLLWPWNRWLVLLVVSCTGAVCLGLWDDLRPMRPYSKLLLQLTLGCVVVAGGVRIELFPWPWLAIPLSVFWLVLMMNAFNLLDNMDGLAAGIGALAGFFCGLHAAAAGQWPVATVAAIISGVCLGFLRYNFPPANIYMGDSGSHLLGLSLAAIALVGSWQHSTQLLSILAVPVFVLAVPIFDTSFVAIQRLLHQRHPFQGGLDHVSHRLAILGLSQRQTILWLYGLGIGLGSLSLASRYLRPLPATVVWLLAFSGLLLFGAHLARVKVYELQRVADGNMPPPTPASTTIIHTMLLHKRRLLEILIDFTLICCAYVAAYVLRFEGSLTPELQQLITQSLPVIIPIKLVCFIGFGLYRGIWKYVSLSDLIAVFKAVTLGSMASAVTVLYLWRFEGFSRAVFIIDWLLLFLAVSAARVAERLLHEWIRSIAEGALPVLIIGADDAGELALRHMKQDSRQKRRVVGFLDDDRRKQGNRIHGVQVLGTPTALPTIMALYNVREVCIATPRPSSELIQTVRTACEPHGVRWRMISAVTEH